MKQKTKKYYIIGILISVLCISNYFVRKFEVGNLNIFSPISLFTYFGVLIGFSLTIYTFGHSMVSDIINKTFDNPTLSDKEKYLIQDNLFSGFKEIQEDIWLIFIALIAVIVFAGAKLIENPLIMDIEKFKVPETINVALFITTSIAMWDIVKTLFNLAEINFEINKVQKKPSA